MTQIEKICAEIERLKEVMPNDDLQPTEEAKINWMAGKLFTLVNLEVFIESLEKEPKGKTNPLFEECLANVDPAVRKEVHENIDKMLEKEKSEIPTIKGWVARDKDGSLTFFSVRPIKFEEYAERWYVPGACTTCYLGFHDDYKDLTWESDPIEVELTISRVIK